MHQWHRVVARPGAYGADISTGSCHDPVPELFLSRPGVLSWLDLVAGGLLARGLGLAVSAPPLDQSAPHLSLAAPVVGR